MLPVAKCRALRGEFPDLRTLLIALAAVIRFGSLERSQFSTQQEASTPRLGVEKP